MSLGATEVADFLKDNPDFLNHNPGILAFVSLPSNAAGNVSSLQDRQVQTLRDKVRIMEQRLVEMTRAAVENHAIIQSLQALQRSLLAVRDANQLPAVLVQGIQNHFKVPQVQLKIWNKSPEFLPSGLDAQPAPATLDNLTAGTITTSGITTLTGTLSAVTTALALMAHGRRYQLVHSNLYRMTEFNVGLIASATVLSAAAAVWIIWH